MACRWLPEIFWNSQLGRPTVRPDRPGEFSQPVTPPNLVDRPQPYVHILHILAYIFMYVYIYRCIGGLGELVRIIGHPNQDIDFKSMSWSRYSPSHLQIRISLPLKSYADSSNDCWTSLPDKTHREDNFPPTAPAFSRHVSLTHPDTNLSKTAEWTGGPAQAYTIIWK